MGLMTRGGNATRSGRFPESGNMPIEVGGTLPEAPESLGDAGKLRWHQIGGIIEKRGMWSNDWVPALEHLCREYDNLSFIDEALKEPDQFMMVPSSGGRTLKTNPLMDYRLKIEAFIQSQLGAFGLTPMSSKGIFTQDDSQQKKKGAIVRPTDIGDLFN